MTGKDLQKKRESLHLDIKHISDLLKINSDYLRAIEHDNFDKLPVAVYTKGYIRCYAEHLGVDPQPIIKYYSEYVSNNEKISVVPKEMQRGKTQLYYFMIPLIVVGAVLLLGFFLFPHDESGTVRVDQPADRDAVTKYGSGAVPVTEETEEGGPGQNMSTTAAEAVVPGTKDTPPDVQQSGADKKVRNLHILAHEVTWIHIQFDEEVSDEVLLQPGESKTWAVVGQVLVKIGNAGGVEVNFDGNDLGIPGKKGQVITLNLPRNE